MMTARTSRPGLFFRWGSTMDSFVLTIAGLGTLLALFVLFGPQGRDTGDGGGSGDDGFNCAGGDAGGDGD
jgi:hypothetical protein